MSSFEFCIEERANGVRAYMPVKEARVFEFERGKHAKGVRGFIDPFDATNPYGPQTAADRQEMEIFVKEHKTMPPANDTTGTTMATEMSNLDNINLSII